MDKNDLRKQLLYENEVMTNRLASLALGVFGILLASLVLLDALGIYDVGGRLCWNGLLIAAIFSCFVYPLGRHFEFREKWIKKAILASVLVSSGITFFFYPTNADFLSYLPVIISAMYYDKTLIRRTSIFACVLYGLMLQANITLEVVSESMRDFHAFQEVGLFRFPMEVLTYHFIPHAVSFFVVDLICEGIARRGIEFIHKQVRSTQEIYAMESDLNAASEMQASTLPDNEFMTEGGGIRITSFMRPAKAVGGDFYDYFMNGDNIVFLVADVSDKGLPAALFMMKAKNAIRAAFLSGGSFDRAIELANGLLCTDNNENMFITLWIGSVNIRNGVGRYANCGHLPPMIRHRDGTVTELENEPNLMLGVFSDAVFETHLLRLEAGDTLVVYSDGLTDAVNRDGEHFGEERMREIVSRLTADTLEKSSVLVDAVDRFVDGAEQFDDMTTIRVHLFSAGVPSVRTLDCTAGAETTEDIIDSVNALLSQTSCPMDVRRNIDVAIDEVCENIFEHAFDGHAGRFSLNVVCGENYLDMEFVDSGAAFNPLEYNDSPLGGELQIGGLGIQIFVGIMDEVTYERHCNENHLRLIKLWDV